MGNSNFKDVDYLRFTLSEDEGTRERWICEEISRFTFFSKYTDPKDWYTKHFFEGNMVLVHAVFITYDFNEVERGKALDLVTKYYNRDVKTIKLR
jgi:hypothetical protein